ncbi:MAG: DUF3810 domain-containing protein [Clostridium sp.]|nr:DUF3810 domain-containing protein [Clostridium sp.]
MGRQKTVTGKKKRSGPLLCSFPIRSAVESIISVFHFPPIWNIRPGSIHPRPKPLLVSWILSVQQLSGIYSPFTVEANYNQEMTAYNIPHTICHELSHLRGFMREDEANFIGFLACIGSEDAEYRYSGYLSGWIYAGNALAKVDFDAYAACLDRLREEVLLDLRENSIFWGRYESKISEAAETVNNTYLKANNQKYGVRSYGRVVDLMLSWYLSGGV